MKKNNLKSLGSNDFDPKSDGKTHVNIFSRSKTQLGRLLSNFANTPFTYQGISYKSVEGCLYFHRTENKKLINLHGSAAKKLGSQLEEKRVESRELLKAWLYAKIFANPEIIELLLKNKLPFTHYYVMFGKKIDAGGDLPELWQEISKAIYLIFSKN